MRKLIYLSALSVNCFALTVGVHDVKVSSTVQHDGDNKVTQLVVQQREDFTDKIRAELSRRGFSVAKANDESARTKHIQQEYVLFSEIANVRAQQRIPRKIVGTNRYSLGYEINIVLNCRLIDSKTQQIADSFSIHGVSGDIKLSANQEIVLNTNYTNLIDQLGRDIADQLANKLDTYTQNNSFKINPTTKTPENKDI